MGGIRWSDNDWDAYKTSTQTKTRSQIFTQTGLSDDLNPLNFKVRESRDSDANPKSTPIIVACDVTGSMGYLSEQIVKNGLGVIMKEIYDRKPVTDPHVMCAATGDVMSDHAPIQMTQFEAGVAALTSQVEKIYLEGNGGGNGGESYNTVWYGAAFRTSCDSQAKRGKKGYLFTIGDEPPHRVLSKDAIKRFFGDDVERDLTSEELRDVVNQNWHVFHLLVGNYSGSVSRWRDLLGERAIPVSDVSKLAEVIVSTIQVIEGHDVADVVGSWSGDTSVVVRNAVSGLRAAGGSGSGVVAL